MRLVGDLSFYDLQIAGNRRQIGLERRIRSGGRGCQLNRRKRKPQLEPIFRPEWRTDTVVSLARTTYDTRDFSGMPILADALQEAGCEQPIILSHCRDTNHPHVRGCWVVDLVLSKS